jgi:hypothetical protein
MSANSGHVIGIISDVAFSFMVHEPREIMEYVSDRSRACSLCRYRSSCVSEWCVLNTGWVR